MQNEKSQLQNRAALRVLQSRLLLLRKEQEDAKRRSLPVILRQAGVIRCARMFCIHTRW